jgi:hypothetical protein
VAIDAAIAAAPSTDPSALTAVALAAWWSNTRTSLLAWHPPDTWPLDSCTNPVAGGSGTSDPPASNSTWNACFAGLLPTGLGGVPARCAALMCSPLDAVSVDLVNCQCGTSSGTLPKYVASRCGAIDCPEGLPVIYAPNLCGCAKQGFETSQVAMP